MDKFEPDNFQKKLKGESIGLLSNMYNNLNTGKLVIMRFKELSGNVPKVNNRVARFNQLYRDHFDVNYSKVIPYIENILLQQLLTATNKAVNTMSPVSHSHSYQMPIMSSAHFSSNLWYYYQPRSSDFHSVFWLLLSSHCYAKNFFKVYVLNSYPEVRLSIFWFASMWLILVPRLQW